MTTTIDQWRSVIGSFGRFRSSHAGKVVDGMSALESPSLILMTVALLLVYSNIMEILLLRAGIEANPGPNNHNQSGMSI